MRGRRGSGCVGKNTQKEARAPRSANTCTRTHSHMRAHTRKDRESFAHLEYCDSDNKETKLVKDLLSSSSNHHPCLCFSMIQRLLSMSAWGFSLALSYHVGGRRGKKINFQFPSIALGLCNQLSL